MASHGDRGRESASFKRAGGIQTFVFDEDIRIFAAAQQGGEAFAERDGRSFRKYRSVTPHGGSQRQQRCRRESFLDAVKIIARVEDTAILGTHSLWTVGRIMLAAARAFEVSEARHGESLALEHARLLASRIRHSSSLCFPLGFIGADGGFRGSRLVFL